MTDEDDTLFRRLMAETRPLKTARRVAPVTNKPKPRARFARADAEAVLEESLSADIDDSAAGLFDAMHFKRASVGRSTMRLLARGSYAVQAEIDLHGMTLAEAKPRLEEFVRRCATNHKLCIRIVHGKGLGSGERGPVLKQAVNRWLRRWDVVLAFTSARQVDGGTGAVYVLLRPAT